MRLLYTAFILFFSYNSIAQLNKESFKEIFEQEEIDLKYTKRNSHSNLYQHTPAQRVPKWLVNLPQPANNELYSIGISDPAMDSTNAVEMAIYRARVMASIFEYSTTRLLCDFFKNEDNGTNNIMYENFSRITSQMPLNDDFEVVKVSVNRFNETIVLLKAKISHKPNYIRYNKIELEFFKNETESSTYGEIESIYELRIEPDSIASLKPMFFQLTEFGKRSSIISGFNGPRNKVPIYGLKYTGIPNADSVKYSFFAHGLWNEYLKSVTEFILSKAREKPENIKYLTASHNRESIKNITRGISVNRMSFILSGIKVSNNHIKVSLIEQPLKHN